MKMGQKLALEAIGQMWVELLECVWSSDRMVKGRGTAPARDIASVNNLMCNEAGVTSCWHFLGSFGGHDEHLIMQMYWVSV